MPRLSLIERGVSNSMRPVRREVGIQGLGEDMLEEESLRKCLL